MTGGVIRGVGMQKVGAMCNLVGYYIIGLPIGLLLMFPAGLGVVGKDELGIMTDCCTKLSKLVCYFYPFFSFHQVCGQDYLFALQ